MGGARASKLLWWRHPCPQRNQVKFQNDQLFFDPCPTPQINQVKLQNDHYFFNIYFWCIIFFFSSYIALFMIKLLFPHLSVGF